jgi:hypothetical protein
MFVKEIKQIINSSIQNIPLMDAFNITNLIIDSIQVNLYWLSCITVEDIDSITFEPTLELEIKGCFLAKSPEQAWELYCKSGIPIALSEEQFLVHLHESKLQNGQKFYSSKPKIQYFSILTHDNINHVISEDCVYKRPTKQTKRKQFLYENYQYSSIYYEPMLDCLF